MNQPTKEQELEMVEEFKTTIREWILEDQLDVSIELEACQTIEAIVEFLGEHYPDSELYWILC